MDRAARRGSGGRSVRLSARLSGAFLALSSQRQQHGAAPLEERDQEMRMAVARAPDALEERDEEEEGLAEGLEVRKTLEESGPRGARKSIRRSRRISRTRDGPRESDEAGAREVAPPAVVEEAHDEVEVEESGSRRSRRLRSSLRVDSGGAASISGRPPRTPSQDAPHETPEEPAESAALDAVRQVGEGDETGSERENEAVQVAAPPAAAAAEAAVPRASLERRSSRRRVSAAQRVRSSLQRGGVEILPSLETTSLETVDERLMVLPEPTSEDAVARRSLRRGRVPARIEEEDDEDELEEDELEGVEDFDVDAGEEADEDEDEDDDQAEGAARRDRCGPDCVCKSRVPDPVPPASYDLRLYKPAAWVKRPILPVPLEDVPDEAGGNTLVKRTVGRFFKSKKALVGPASAEVASAEEASSTFEEAEEEEEEELLVDLRLKSPSYQLASSEFNEQLRDHPLRSRVKLFEKPNFETVCAFLSATSESDHVRHARVEGEVRVVGSESRRLGQEEAPRPRELGWLPDGREAVAFSGAAWFPSVAHADISLTRGKWYYEVEVKRMTHALFQVGWATAAFTGRSMLERQPTSGVGDCASSWAFDGGRGCTWHRAQKQTWGERCKAGAVVGCAVDLDSKTISFSVGGRWDEPLGVAFRDVQVGGEHGGVFPALSLHQGSQVVVNLGQAAFRHTPPDDSYRSVHEWVRDRNSAEARAARGFGKGEDDGGLQSLGLANARLGAALLESLMRVTNVGLRELTKLDLSGNTLGGDLQRLESLAGALREAAPRLRTLSLANNALRVAGLERLEDLLSGMEDICLDKNMLCGRVGGDAIGRLIRDSPRLCALSVRGNFLGDFGTAAVFEAAGGASRLRSLCVDNNDAGSETAACLMQVFKESATIEAVVLRSNPALLPMHMDLLAAGKGLKEIDLGWLGMGPQHVDGLLSGLQSAPRLEKLGLAGNKLSLPGYTALVNGCHKLSRGRARGLSLDLSSNGLAALEVGRLLEAVAKATALEQVDLSRNLRVGLELALSLLKTYRALPKCPAVDLSSSAVPPASAEVLLRLGRSRKLDRLDDRAALRKLFLSEWDLSQDDLPLFSRLYSWLEQRMRETRDTGPPPELRVSGDLELRLGPRVASARADFMLPRRVHVAGNASFNGIPWPLFKSVERFAVDGMLWVEDCRAVDALPASVVVGKHLMLCRVPIRSISVTLKDPARGLELMHLVDLPRLEQIGDRVRTNTLRIESCPQLREVHHKAVRVSLFLYRCPAVQRLAADMSLQFLQVQACENLKTIRATVSQVLEVRQCPAIKSVGEQSLERIVLHDCGALSELRAIPRKSLSLVECPFVRSLPRDLRSLESLHLDNCYWLALPLDLTVTQDCALHNFERLKELPPGLALAQSLVLSRCGIRGLPPDTRAKSLVLGHCPRLEALHDGVRPRKLKVTCCDRLRGLSDANVPDVAEASTVSLPMWSALACRNLEALPTRGTFGSLALTDCPALVKLPEALIVRQLKVAGCKGIVRFGGQEGAPMAAHAVTLERCNFLASVRHLRCHSLNIDECRALSTLDDTVNIEHSLSLSRVPNVRNVPDDIVRSANTILLRDTGIRVDRMAQMDELAREHNTVVTWDEGDDFDYDLSELGDGGFTDLAEAVLFWEAAAELKPGKAGLEDVSKAVQKYYQDGVLKFLSKLRTAAEFQRDETRSGLARRVIEVFQTVVDDEFSREEILTRMVDSVDRCGDKPIWALNQITLTARVSKARGDRDKLRELGHAIMRLDAVHGHARRKINQLGGDVDDVCVYLKFEIELRKDLDLPVSAQHMLFPKYIKINKKEIASAREEALNITEEDIEIWLSQWPEWQRQLRLEAADQLVYADLRPAEFNKRVSLSLTCFSGDPMTNPVMLGRSGPWNFEELVDRWVGTGMDFLNVKWSVDAFLDKLSRIEM